MDEQKMICPFMWRDDGYCKEDNCAMYCDKSCTIAQIAWRIDEVRELLDNIDTNIENCSKSLASLDKNGIEVI